MASAAKKAKVDSQASKAKKTPCPYGASCYRKNPQHFAEFSHDAGTVPDPARPASASPSQDRAASRQSSTSSAADAGLPPCKYGANCYRKNVLHFAEFSHPTKTTTGPADDGDSGGDTDVYDSDDDQPAKNVAGDAMTMFGNNVLDRGMSLIKSFTKMTEQERKDLIKMAFEAKKKLEEELEATKKEVSAKEKELKQMQEQVNKGMLMVEGEKEALEGDTTAYFMLLPERQYKEGSAAQIHFRLAESQFYRLITGDDNSQYRVTKVQYVVTPKLVDKFKAAREKLKQTRGEDMSYPVLGFHGTDDVNITPICETGFKMPGDSNFREKTDAGWYGAGIYFSEYPSYSMDYIQGATRLLLCQVLPGKVYQCTVIEEGSKLTKGYDSHMSPDKKELVIFDSDCILPCYIVHYTEPSSDFVYKKATAGIKRIRKVGGPGVSAGTLKMKATKAKKQAVSKVFDGKTVLFDKHNMKSVKALAELVKKHKGKEVAASPDAKFDLLVTGEEVDLASEDDNSLVELALDIDKPIVGEEFLYECIFQKKFLDPDYYLHPLYDQ